MSPNDSRLTFRARASETTPTASQSGRATPSKCSTTQPKSRSGPHSSATATTGDGPQPTPPRNWPRPPSGATSKRRCARGPRREACFDFRSASQTNESPPPSFCAPETGSSITESRIRRHTTAREQPPSWYGTWFSGWPRTPSPLSTSVSATRATSTASPPVKNDSGASTARRTPSPPAASLARSKQRSAHRNRSRRPGIASATGGYAGACFRGSTTLGPSSGSRWPGVQGDGHRTHGRPRNPRPRRIHREHRCMSRRASRAIPPERASLLQPPNSWNASKPTGRWRWKTDPFSTSAGTRVGFPMR